MGIKQVLNDMFGTSFGTMDDVAENEHPVKVTLTCAVCGVSREFDTTNSYGRDNPVNLFMHGFGWCTSHENLMEDQDYYFCPQHVETAKIRQKLEDDHQARKDIDMIQMEEEWDEANPGPTMQQAIALMRAKEHKSAIDV